MRMAVSGPSAAAVADNPTGRAPKAQRNTGTWDNTYAAAHASAQRGQAQEDAPGPATNRPHGPGQDIGQQGARASQAQADPQPAPSDPAGSVQKAPPTRRGPPPSVSGHSLLPPAPSAADAQNSGAAAPPRDVAANAPHPAKPSNPATSAPEPKPLNSAPEDSRRQAAKITTRNPATAEDLHPTVATLEHPPLGRKQTDAAAAGQGVGSGAPPSQQSSPHLPLTPQRDRKPWHLVSGQHAAQPPLAATMTSSGNHAPPPQTSVAPGQVGTSAPAGTQRDHGLVTVAAPPISSVMPAPLHQAAVHASFPASDPQTPNQAPQGLLQQTAASLALDKGGTAHVTLHPPTLGRVTVQVTMASSGAAHIQITAATPDGYAALATSSTALLHHLADQGVTVGSMQMQMQGDTGRGGTSGGEQRNPGSHQPTPTTRWVPRNPDEAVIAYA